MNILIKLPSIRPKRMYEAVENIHMAFAGTNYTIQLTTDGESKIHAFNKDIPKTGWDLLIATSDDMEFREGAGLAIESEFKRLFPIGDGFLHMADGNRTDICTLSIMDKKYYDRDGYIYHPSYKSLHCDVEATLIAKQRGRYAFSKVETFIHKHPNYIEYLPFMDVVYAHNNGFDTTDRNNFIKRQKELCF